MEAPYNSFPSDQTSAHAYPPPTSAPYPPTQTTPGALPPGGAEGTVVTDYPAPSIPGVYHPPQTGGAAAPPPSYTQYTTGYPTPQQPPSSATNVTVVSQQPQVTKVIDTQSGAAPESYYVLSAIMCLICFCFGNWLTYICIVPALIFSGISDDRASSGDYIGARKMGRLALICNITVIVFYVISVVIVVVAAVAVVVQRNNQCIRSSVYYRDPVSGDIRARCL